MTLATGPTPASNTTLKPRETSGASEFLKQLQMETRPGTTAPPTAAPPTSPTVPTSGGRGLVFPNSNFEPHVAPLVALLDAAFQSLHRDRLPMNVGGVSVQEYGLIRNRLEKTPQTMEEMVQAQDDIDKLIRMINIAGGEGLEIPDDIKKLLDSWREAERSLSMTQQPNNSNPLGNASQANPIVSPHNPNGPQTQGGLPQTPGSQVGFNNGGASRASGAQGGGGESATERQLRDLLDKLGANNPAQGVYEIITQVISDVIEKNAYAHPEKAAIVAEIARILTSANTGYSNSSIPEFLRITESPEAREAHALSIEIARMQPGQVTSIKKSGETAVAILKQSNGDYSVQATERGVSVRLPSGERVPLEPFATHSYPAGSLLSIPGLAPIEIGRTPRQPTVRHPTNDGGGTVTPRSYNASDYGASTTLPPPLQGPPAPPASSASTSGTRAQPSGTGPNFELPPPLEGSNVPDIGEMNRQLDRALEDVRVKLNGTPGRNETESDAVDRKAREVADIVNRLPPESRAFAAHAASRWAEAILGDSFPAFIDVFDRFNFRQPDSPGDDGGANKGAKAERSERRRPDDKVRSAIMAELKRRGL
jgi:hypothetical protein